jgi:hypothetical protein
VPDRRAEGRLGPPPWPGRPPAEGRAVDVPGLLGFARGFPRPPPRHPRPRLGVHFLPAPARARPSARRPQALDPAYFLGFARIFFVFAPTGRARPGTAPRGPAARAAGPRRRAPSDRSGAPAAPARARVRVRFFPQQPAPQCPARSRSPAWAGPGARPRPRPAPCGSPCAGGGSGGAPDPGCAPRARASGRDVPSRRCPSGRPARRGGTPAAPCPPLRGRAGGRDGRGARARTMSSTAASSVASVGWSARSRPRRRFSRSSGSSPWRHCRWARRGPGGRPLRAERALPSGVAGPSTWRRSCGSRRTGPRWEKKASLNLRLIVPCPV